MSADADLIRDEAEGNAVLIHNALTWRNSRQSAHKATDELFSTIVQLLAELDAALRAERHVARAMRDVMAERDALYVQNSDAMQGWDNAREVSKMLEAERDALRGFVDDASHLIRMNRVGAAAWFDRVAALAAATPREEQT